MIEKCLIIALSVAAIAALGRYAQQSATCTLASVQNVLMSAAGAKPAANTCTVRVERAK